MTIVFWTVCSFIYLQVGYRLGKSSWKTWYKGKKDTDATRLLFPLSTLRGVVGDKEEAPINIFFGSEKTYAYSMAFLWPLKPVWALGFWSSYGIWKAAVAVIGPIFKGLIEGPEIALRKLEESRKRKALPPSEEFENVIELADNYRLLQERKVETEAKLSEFEARPDFEKIRAARTRL